MNEITPTRGSISVSGLQIIYAPQKAWILPGTVRQNITFTYDYDAAWFAEVVDACALTRDLELFESGADTEIGERGVTLSGGQKARLSLARAIYATKFASAASGEKCLVLLDDPFSALDPKVGHEVFEKVVQGVLKEHASLVITHQKGFAKSADKVFVLDRQGQEIENVDLNQLALDNPSQAEEQTVDDATDKAKAGGVKAAASAMASRKQAKSVVLAETRDRGAIAARTYMSYLNAAGSPLAIAATFFLMIAAQTSMILSDFYLAEWSKLSEQDQINERTSGSWYHLKIYSTFFAIFVVFLFIRSAAYMHLTVQASRGLHDRAFRSMMDSSIRFFDQQPVGRILNRFAKDMAYVDELLPETCFVSNLLDAVLLCSCATVASHPFLSSRKERKKKRKKKVLAINRVLLCTRMFGLTSYAVHTPVCTSLHPRPFPSHAGLFPTRAVDTRDRHSCLRAGPLHAGCREPLLCCVHLCAKVQPADNARSQAY